MRIGILGGGLAGLVVGSQIDHENEVIEAQDQIGGHCRSLIRDGYIFDRGGPHILFSRDAEILAYIRRRLGQNARRKRRHNAIFFKGRLVKYPFENGLYDLAPEDRFDCLYHYLKNDAPEPSNFKEWIYYTFGSGIAEKYMIPYNEKIWNLPAEEMSFDWVEGRVPKPPLEDVIKSAVGVETEGYTHQLHFYYPHAGGIEALPRSFADECPAIVTGFPITKVWREGDGWRVSDGERVKSFDRLVSTIPVQSLIHALPGVPAAVQEAVRALRFNSLIVVMLGARRRNPPPQTAIYVPDPARIFHRLSFPLNFTEAGAPPGCFAVAAEITTNPGDGIHQLTDGEIIRRTVDGLAAMDLIDPRTIEFQAVERAEYAYVVRTFDYRENLSRVLDYLDGLGIISVGRNAEFQYLNMDVTIQHALAVAKKLNGTPSEVA